MFLDDAVVDAVVRSKKNGLLSVQDFLAFLVAFFFSKLFDEQSVKRCFFSTPGLCRGWCVHQLAKLV